MTRIIWTMAAVALLGGTACGSRDDSCKAPLQICAGVCTDPASDLANCGTCGNACPAGDVCSAGTCALSCQTGTTDCAGSCSNLSSDRANCGACGNACQAGDVCSAGACALSCQTGLTDCAGSCSNPSSDRANCGACGNACPAGDVCSAGACALSCQTGTTDCAGSCSNLSSDRANCGACGNACPAGDVCSAGACALSCQTGLTDCAGSCSNLSSDLANCGACGTVCPAGDVCSAGACALSCQAGLTDCGGTCADLASDQLDCGACGHVCPTGSGCSGGACTTTSAPALGLVAGIPSGLGNIDGTGAGARFMRPGGVAEDGAGNVYVADTYDSTIRKITPTGVVTTLAGSPGQQGSADGTGAAARFNWPTGVAIDSAGNLYVADTGNSTIRMITSAGEVSTLAGTAGTTGAADGPGSAASFDLPGGVAVYSTGTGTGTVTVYVADTGNSTVRAITGGNVITVAGTAGVTGAADGTDTTATFNHPNGIAVDAAGHLYVADTANSTVRSISGGNVITVAGTALATGYTDGTGAAARFDLPGGVAVDSSGTLYVADTANSTIRAISGGAVTTIAGAAQLVGSADGAATAARFDLPGGLAVGAGGVAVADTSNSTVRLLAGGQVTTLAGSAGETGSTDGASWTARFDDPTGIGVSAAGVVYVADTVNSTIRAVAPDGVVSTLAGSPGLVGSADGAGAAARFDDPYGVAVDAAGTIYVADTFNDTIRAITPAGAVTTFAGSPGLAGSTDATGSAARFDHPYGIAVDAAGNLYVADTGNSTIRKITPAGAVTTLAGSPGLVGSADGTGAAARFDDPYGVAVDAAGTVYVSDTFNDTLRAITPAGAVTTLAGTAGVPGSADGTGAAARFDQPYGITVDVAGAVYVADTGNSTVRRVTPAGVVTTVIGAPGVAGTVPGPLPASLFFPLSVAYDPVSGLLLVTVPDALLAAWF